MRIYKENTVALVVDFQERLVPVIEDNKKILDRTAILLEGLEVLGVESIVTRQYPRGLGETVEEIKVVTKNAKTYDKLEFSCYENPNIKKAVDRCNARNIILVGIEAHVCVLQTAVDLVGVGYNVVLVVDCIGSRDNDNKNIAIDRLNKEGVTLTTSESILFELTRKAGTDQFKKISALIK